MSSLGSQGVRSAIEPQALGLWRHRDFIKLWSAQTISVFGSQFTGLAIPIIAALTLQATPAQMGVLTAVEFAPFLLIGLFAGVWVDAGLLTSFSNPVYNINQVSLRQAITAQRLQGRMNATMRFLVWGTMPLGGLAGGALGEALGLRGAIAVTALGGLLAFVWVLFSPVRSLRQIPEPVARAPRSKPFLYT